MVGKNIEKFGFWPSEFSAEMVGGKTIGFSELETSDTAIFWTESKPDEGGRNTIVRRDVKGAMQEIIKAPYNATSKVHEYGGGSFGLGATDLVFVNAADQDLYKVDLVGKNEPVRLTNMPEMRFADIQIFGDDIIAVGELHDKNAVVSNMPDNMLVRLKLDACDVTAVETIAQPKKNGGADFYCYPRVSPCGKKIAYMAWDLPFMPWQNAKIMLADISDAGLSNEICIAGGEGVACFAPTWGKKPKLNGADALADLYYISDETGFGNLYCYDGKTSRNLLPIEAECGHPNWVFGMRSFDVLPNGHIVIRVIEAGMYKLALVEPLANKAQMLDSAFRQVDKITSFGDGLVALATTDDMAEMIVLFSPWAEKFGILRKSSDVQIERAEISVGQVFKYAVGDDGAFAYGIYYPPLNANYKGDEAELPPVIVKAHGGPTGIAGRGYNVKFNYWTNRGFGVVDLDYRGSFGYGRDYIEQLDGNWGITDVEDAIAAVQHLANDGLVDGHKAIITGGSAGGYTVLMALATTDVFLGGTSYYGVADLSALAKFTHKFELKYMDDLVGLNPNMSEADVEKLFYERSPLSKLAEYSSPTLFLQGLDDKVVPPAQSEIMYKALKNRGVKTDLVMFEGEGHGFRKPENKIKALELELNFYKELLS